jgi:formylmethanofuran dehydrogenase subunit C
MNDGAIIIHGSSGDATGYGMRGGKIFVWGTPVTGRGFI